MGIKVSIIVPVYGTESYLRKCLDSLIEQTLKEVEILVVNDGSPDKSQDIINEYAEKYSQIRSFEKENGGLSDTRNYGVRKAKGDYIVFVDSDDYIESDMCEFMYEQAVGKDLDIVVCDTFMDYPTHSYVLKADNGYTDDAVKSYIFCYPNAPARMIRTSIMREHMFKKGIWYEDLELMPTLAAYTNKIGFANRPFYHYVQHEGSIMNQSGFNPKFYDIFSVLENIKAVYEEEGLWKQYYSELEYLFIIHLQRSGILRFSGVSGAEDCLNRACKVMETTFPNWSNNKYLKLSGWKFRLICLLGRWKKYGVISVLKKLM